jgi:hypothetical protein
MWKSISSFGDAFDLEDTSEAGSNLRLMLLEIIVYAVILLGIVLMANCPPTHVS